MIEVNDNNIEDTLKSDKLVIIDFFAEWCSPCRQLSPTLEEISKENEDKLLVGKVNVDDSPQSSTKYGIRSIPAVFFFKNGEIVGKMIGLQSKKSILDKIESLS